nr:LysR family transcriptional regulator [Thermoactinomyces daqus]
MEWQQLEYFRVVARLEHFTRAAEQLAISQPALSRSIAALEEEIGVPFFKREGRSVRLNRYGHLFLQHVERALAEIEKGKKKIDDLLNPERGLVSLAFLHTLGAQLIPSLLREFREANPFVRFQLYQNSAQHILTQLEAGEIDLCFTSPPGAASRFRLGGFA